MQEFKGTVVKRMFGQGSKSERPAVQLEVAGGQAFVLRIHQHNPFADPELDSLVGKTIVCQGELSGYTLTIVRWEVAG